MFWAGRTSVVLVGTIVLVFAGGASSLTATGDPPAPVDAAGPAISGDAWLRAREAALAAIPSGIRVTESGAGEEDGFYEVEVMLHDGREVDVQVDTSFRVVGMPGDREVPDDGRSAG